MTIKFDTTHADELRALSPYTLAVFAECGTPNGLTSEGAEYLDTVRLSVIENFEYDSWGSYPEDSFHEIADSALPVYNWHIAEAFTDLAAWQEDISDWLPGVTPDNAVIKLMQVSLCIIGERLARALFEQYKHTLEELDEDECTEDDPRTEFEKGTLPALN